MLGCPLLEAENQGNEEGTKQKPDESSFGLYQTTSVLRILDETIITTSSPLVDVWRKKQRVGV